MSCEASPVAPTAPASVGVPSLPQTFSKTIAATNTEEPLTTDVTYANWFRFFAYTEADPAIGIQVNAQDIYWGWKTAVLPNILQAGATYDFQTPQGQKFDLSQIIVFGTQGDKIFVEYS